MDRDGGKELEDKARGRGVREGRGKNVEQEKSGRGLTCYLLLPKSFLPRPQIPAGLADPTRGPVTLADLQINAASQEYTVAPSKEAEVVSLLG